MTLNNVLHSILKQNQTLFESNPDIQKINVGFTNTIYKINDSYIVKICTNTENEKAFKREIDFYLSHKGNPYIPTLISYSTVKKDIQYMYEIIEKIEGVSLYNVWHTFNEEERETIIKKLVVILKSFHKQKGSSYDWSEYITHHVVRYFEEIKTKHILTPEELELVENAIRCFPSFLVSDKFVFIHNDLHFDNIFYKDGDIKIIDFERSMIAPIDKELDIFFRMVEMPWKYASEETEPFTNKKDYENIKGYIQKYYPELVSHPNLDVRLAIYDLREYLRNYPFYESEPDLKEKMINAAKFIIAKAHH